MNNKICLITGATSGIGKETAFALAGMGFHVVIAARNIEKGDKVKKEITEANNNSSVDIMVCDLSSLRDVKRFADEFRSKYGQLDVLINNAGIWETKRKESVDGIEMTFAVNHLAPFLLTNKLLDLMINTPGSRIINVASEAHRYGSINFNDIEFRKSYNHIKVYSQSKLANILFTKELMRRLYGRDVTVNALHPGAVATQLFSNMGSIVKSLGNLFMKSPRKGAQTSIYLAESFEVANTTGEYFKNKRIKASSKESNNPVVAEKLWKISEDYISKFN
jgi:NAD(P)-dependent dehydrogenase (short-subunit alcohol dehydrogenase family)